MINQVTGMENVMADIYYGDLDEYLSNCCGAPLLGESDICSKCKEHSEPMEREEWFNGGEKQDIDPLIQDVSEFKNVTMNEERIK